MNDKTKILEKVKKCMALGKSPNEHEAAAALRQAQKLMAMHNLTEDDLEGVDYVCAEVLTDYEFGKKKPIVIITVAALIQHAMGVDIVMGAGRSGMSRGLVHKVTYCGVRHRVHVAVYAHEVVYRAVGSAWRKYSAENPWMKKQQGARAGFYLGWCDAVKSKVQALLPAENEKKGTERAIAKHFGSGVGKAEVSKQKVHGETVDAGTEAGKSFELNKPINQDRMRIGVDK